MRHRTSRRSGWWARAAAANVSKGLAAQELTGHAAKAVQGFSETLRLNPKDGLTQHDLASLLEEFAEWSKAGKAADLPPELREAYAKALTLAMVRDSKFKNLPLSGLEGIASFDAEGALVRLAKDGDAKLTDAEHQDVERAEKALTHFNSLEFGAITPMVFSFDPRRASRRAARAGVGRGL